MKISHLRATPSYDARNFFARSLDASDTSSIFTFQSCEMTKSRRYSMEDLGKNVIIKEEQYGASEAERPGELGGEEKEGEGGLYDIATRKIRFSSQVGGRTY